MTPISRIWWLSFHLLVSLLSNRDLQHISSSSLDGMYVATCCLISWRIRGQVGYCQGKPIHREPLRQQHLPHQHAAWFQELLMTLFRLPPSTIRHTASKRANLHQDTPWWWLSHSRIHLSSYRQHCLLHVLKIEQLPLKEFLVDFDWAWIESKTKPAITIMQHRKKMN